jgi:hypothetical protein
MAPVLEECTTEDQHWIVRFYGQKLLYAKDIHREMFYDYSGKCLSRNTVPRLWQTFQWWRRSWNGGAEVAETTLERLIRCGFWRTRKAIGLVYHSLLSFTVSVLVKDMWRNHFFFLVSNITYLKFLYTFMNYLLALPRKNCHFSCYRTILQEC